MGNISSIYRNGYRKREAVTDRITHSAGNTYGIDGTDWQMNYAVMIILGFRLRRDVMRLMEKW